MAGEVRRRGRSRPRDLVVADREELLFLLGEAAEVCLLYTSDAADE